MVLWCVAMGTAHPGEALPCKAVAGVKLEGNVLLDTNLCAGKSS